MLIVLQRRRASIRLPQLEVDDFNHPECHIYQEVRGSDPRNLSFIGLLYD